MSALLLAILLLGDPPAATPASPGPTASDKKREKTAEASPKPTPAKKRAPPAKVLTNEDLDKARKGDAAASVLAAGGVEPAPFISEGSSSDQDGSEAATWRQRAEGIRTQITDAATRVKQIDQRLAALRNDLQPQDPMNPFRQQTREAEITAETERLEGARADLAAARQALSDLEEEARRAAIPPGWLREP